MSDLSYKLEKEMISSVKDALPIVEDSFPKAGTSFDPEQIALWNGIAQMISSVNLNLFGFPHLANAEIEKMISVGIASFKKKEYLQAVNEWIALVETVLSRRCALKNSQEHRFYRVIDAAQHVSFDDLLDRVKENIRALPMELKARLNIYYQGFSHMWGSLDMANDNYEVVENRIHSLIEHTEDFIWLYQALADQRSRFVLVTFLEYWLDYDPYRLFESREHAFGDYFDLDLYAPDENEVFVDLGSFTGDTILDYLKTYPSYKRIYCFELSPANMRKIQENLSPYPNIRYIEKAAGAQKGSMRMHISSEVDSANSFSKTFHEDEASDIEITTVDDEISEPVTTIKMDIEGAEQDALKGCRRHIKEDHPKLLICVYHNNEDIWKIPRMIHEMNPDYRFFLRNNGNQWGPSEIVLFGL